VKPRNVKVSGLPTPRRARLFAAKRPNSRDQADRVNTERLQHVDERIGSREEQLAEDEVGDRVVKQEILPFDRVAHGARDNGVAEKPMVQSRGGKRACMNVRCVRLISARQTRRST